MHCDLVSESPILQIATVFLDHFRVDPLQTGGNLNRCAEGAFPFRVQKFPLETPDLLAHDPQPFVFWGDDWTRFFWKGALVQIPDLDQKN
jgi:hypothetical protein